jgi:hypothetical protein
LFPLHFVVRSFSRYNCAFRFKKTVITNFLSNLKLQN